MNDNNFGKSRPWELKLSAEELFKQFKVLWSRDEPNNVAVNLVELGLLVCIAIGLFVSLAWALAGVQMACVTTLLYSFANVIALYLSRKEKIVNITAARFLVFAIYCVVFVHVFAIWDRSVASIAWIMVAMGASLLFLTLKESAAYFVLGLCFIFVRVLLVSKPELPFVEITEWVLVMSILFGGITSLTAISVHFSDETAAQIEKIRESEEEVRRTKRARDLFFSEVSHDLLTPLNAICGISNMMIEQEDKETDEALKSRLHSSSKQLLILVRDLLDHTKLENNTLSLMKQPFNIKKLISDAYSVCEVLAVSNNVDLILDIDPQLPNYVMGDEQRMMQILFNLVNNAIKFSPNGEVRIVVRQNSNHLKDEFTTIIIEVIDTGIGIDPEDQEIIFETYTQANPEITRRFGGTGLGLSITKSLVELIGGEIKLKSALGKGSTFIVVADFEVVDVLITKESELYVSQRELSILIVDDSEINRKLAKSQLSKRFPNAQFEEACDGVEAVDKAKARNEAYSAIIMDIKMPKMNGIEASKAIFNLDDRRAKTNIYGLSADNNAEQIAKCLKIGLRDYVLKPCDYDLLASVIDADIKAQTIS